MAHIKDLRTRCLRGLQLLSSLSRLKWEADRTTLLHIYRSLVRSRLDYGCQIYASATASTLKVLDPVHHRGLRLATATFRSSPVVSIYVRQESRLWNIAEISCASRCIPGYERCRTLLHMTCLLLTPLTTYLSADNIINRLATE